MHMTLMGLEKKSLFRNLIQKQSHCFQIQTWFQLTGPTHASATGFGGGFRAHMLRSSPPKGGVVCASSGELRNA